MRPVKRRPAFRCDFCSKVGMKATIERHERLCFRNPARFCPTCKNTGTLEESYGSAGTAYYPCPYCPDPEQTLVPVTTPDQPDRHPET